MAIIYNEENESIGEFLDRVHDEITFAWKLEERAAADQVKAQRLSWYLRAIKLKAQGLNVTNMVGAELDAQFGELALQVFAMQKQGGSGVRSAKKLFGRSHSSTKVTAQGADDIFEEELYYTLKAIENMAVKENVTIPVGAALAGKNPMNIANYISADKEVANVIDHYKHNIAKKLEETTTTGDEPYDRPKTRAGKTDLKGLSAEVDISASIKPEWQEFFELLSDATFSLKNYAGGKWVGKEWIQEVRQIGLGNTDIYKAYAGVLSTLGADSDTINKTFTKSYYAFINGYDTSRISLRLYQIRFVYELVGAGLIDVSTQEAEHVRYLIWNDPGSNIISVVSTAWLMLQEFKRTENKGVDNPFGKVSVSQGVFPYGKN